MTDHRIVGRLLVWVTTLVTMLNSGDVLAAVDLPALTLTTDDNGDQSYSVSIQILALMDGHHTTTLLYHNVDRIHQNCRGVCYIASGHWSSTNPV